MRGTVKKDLILSVTLLSVITGELRPQSYAYDSGGRLSAEQAAYDVTYYSLALRIEPANQSIDGSLSVWAQVVSPTEWLVLDLDPALDVTDVTGNIRQSHGTSLNYERRGGQIWVQLPKAMGVGQEIALTVDYGGHPRVAPNPPWDGGFTWAQTPDGDPWIATTCQQEGPDIWWPTKDHPSDKPDSMALYITVPQPLVVASNGRLKDTTTNEDGTRTYHWFVSTPISSYTVALNIAPYRTVAGTYTSITGDTLPVTFWVLPHNVAQAEHLMPEVLDHLRFFEDVAGPYPFRADKYGVVQTPHLGMEHQTIIAYGAGFDNGAMTGGVDWGFDALHHHELSHEWWGNMVTNTDWSQMWLHEGFGSYMQPLYLERIRGPSVARAYLAGIRGSIANRAAVAPREPTTAKQIYGHDIYYKGAWILHTLRFLIGEDAFLTLLRRWAYPDPAMEGIRDGRQVRFATTDDFLHTAEEVSASDLDWFFEVYLRQPDLPRLSSSRSGDSLELAWEVPGDLAFPMPIEVLVGSDTHRVEMPGGRGVLFVPPGASVEIDPLNWVLKEDRD
jgi:aminopeptidase N